MKYFVGTGNNNHIVKVILRQRFLSNWSFKDRGCNGTEFLWQIEETKLDDVNFIWT